MGVKVKERSGAWWLFINHKGRRKAKKVGDKKAAELAAVQIRARLALGDSVLLQNRPAAPTFKEAADRWLATHAQLEQIRETTHKEYARALRTYAYPKFGSKPVTEVTRPEIRGLLVDLMAQGKSRSLARNLLAPIRQTFNGLIDDGILTANPAARMGRYLKEQTDRRARAEFLRPEEEAVLLQAARAHYSRYYGLILCALRTGLRIGELFGLQWDDLDLENRFIEVRRTLRDGKKVYSPKNKKIRRVDMSRQLVSELKRLRAERTKETLAKGWGKLPDWVFCSAVGNPLWLSNFERRVFHPLLKKAGLRRIRFHALRHTFASRLLQNKESVVYVKEQMGHSSIQVTVDIYGHLIPGANKAAVDRLDVTERNPRATANETGAPERPASH